MVDAALKAGLEPRRVFEVDAAVGQDRWLTLAVIRCSGPLLEVVASGGVAVVFLSRAESRNSFPEVGDLLLLPSNLLTHCGALFDDLRHGVVLFLRGLILILLETSDRPVPVHQFKADVPQDDDLVRIKQTKVDVSQIGELRPDEDHLVEGPFEGGLFMWGIMEDISLGRALQCLPL